MQGEAARREAARLLADDYAGRILSATFEEPMSIQQISRVCDIPIAVAYRRMAEMEELGLIRSVCEIESYHGKRVKLYTCAVRTLQLAFNEGKLSTIVDPLP